jgi:Cu/Ag efflux protein CusF
MKQMTYSAIAAAFIALPALAGAQQPNPNQAPPPTPAPAPAPAPMPEQRADKADKKTDVAKGELVKVDADAKKITIKDATGVETEFAYTATTEFAGREGVAGLATKSGSKVTVHFTNDMGTKTATKIEVAGDKKSS